MRVFIGFLMVGVLACGDDAELSNCDRLAECCASLDDSSKAVCESALKSGQATTAEQGQAACASSYQALACADRTIPQAATNDGGMVDAATPLKKEAGKISLAVSTTERFDGVDLFATISIYNGKSLAIPLGYPIFTLEVEGGVQVSAYFANGACGEGAFLSPMSETTCILEFKTKLTPEKVHYNPTVEVGVNAPVGDLKESESEEAIHHRNIQACQEAKDSYKMSMIETRPDWDCSIANPQIGGVSGLDLDTGDCVEDGTIRIGDAKCSVELLICVEAMIRDRVCGRNSTNARMDVCKQYCEL